MWTIGSALERDIFVDPLGIWSPEGDGILYWVGKTGGLGVAWANETDDECCEFHVTSFHLGPAEWTIELTSTNATFGPVADPGFLTNWEFRSGSFKLEVGGQIIVRGGTGPGEPDEAETFAQALAHRLGWGYGNLDRCPPPH